MPKIDESTIRQIRDLTDIKAVVGDTVKLTKRGRSWVGLCPFHRERTTSFTVNTERRAYHCFGCGEHGDVIDFVMKTEGLTFPEAARRVAERSGVEVREVAGTSYKEELDVRREKDSLYAANSIAATFFEKMLVEHPHGRLGHEELGRRGLVAERAGDAVDAALKSFRVGYAPADWSALATYLKAQGIPMHEAEQAGLVGKGSSGSYFDRFRSRLMFAVIDLQGRVVAFSGRILADPRTGEVDKETGKYINSPETPIYKKGETVFGLYQARQAVRQSGEVVLVEGNFDVVSLHARGLLNVVAPLGTAFTVEQAAQIKRFAPSVVLLFDGDAAGRKATRAAREPCKRAGLDVKAAQLPNGVDPDDLCREHGPEAVKAVLGSARGLLEHLISTCLNVSFKTTDSQEKKTRLKEVVDLLSAEDDPSMRAMASQFANEVAAKLMSRDDRTGMANGAIFRSLTQTVEQAMKRLEGANRMTIERDRVTEEVLGSIFDFPQLLGDAEVHALLSYMEGDAVFVVPVLRAAGSKLDVEHVAGELPVSLRAFAIKRLVAPVLNDAQEARQNLLMNLRRLQLRHFNQEMESLSERAAEAERIGDMAEMEAFLREMHAIKQQKSRIIGS